MAFRRLIGPIPLSLTSYTKLKELRTASQTEPAVSEASSNRRRRAAALLVAVVLLKPFSNLVLTWGVRGISAGLALNPALLLRVLSLLTLGIGMQIFWMLARMALLSIADLSFVLPVTASGYLISALLGRVFLHEQVSPAQWTGTILIFAGAVLVGSTPRDSTPLPSDSEPVTAAR